MVSLHYDAEVSDDGANYRRDRSSPAHRGDALRIDYTDYGIERVSRAIPDSEIPCFIDDVRAQRCGRRCQCRYQRRYLDLRTADLPFRIVHLFPVRIWQDLICSRQDHINGLLAMMTRWNWQKIYSVATGIPEKTRRSARQAHN